MASTTDQLIALAAEGAFRLRVRNLVLLEAAAIIAEPGGTALHPQRVAYAFKVVATPGFADQVADFLCSRTNLIAANTTYDFARRAVVSDATDAQIRSQINTDWNTLAGAQ